MKNRPIKFNIEETDLSALDANADLFQTGFWGILKGRFGWTPRAFKVSADDLSFTLLLLLRGFGFGLGIAYVPMGPLISEPETGKEEILKNLAASLYDFLPPHITFIRFDLPWQRIGTDNFPPALVAKGALCKSPADIQPAHTVILDIDQEPDRILGGMKHKTRYNIKLAEKKGVRVIESPGEKLDEWYALYRITAIRDRIALHSSDYYKTIFSLAGDYRDNMVRIKLLNAYADDELVAGIIIAVKGDAAWYLYGASSDKKRNYMPNHALQWKAIRIAKNLGCKSYNLYGIPPKDDPHHPMYGLYQFKTGFGGRIVHRFGCYDIIRNHLGYSGYRIAEKARDFYYKKIRKMIG